MELKKPTASQRKVVLYARDAATGKSKAVTIYDATPERVICFVKKTLRTLNRAR